jgi:hypothetical protein
VCSLESLLSCLFVPKMMMSAEKPISKIYFYGLLLSRAVRKHRKPSKHFLKSRKIPLKLHLMTKALTSGSQRLVFASSIVSPGGFIANMYAAWQQLQEWGRGAKTIAPC